MGLTNQQAAVFDLLNMIEDQPVIATWQGDDYEGTAGGLVTRQELEPGGFLEDYDYIWTTSLRKRMDPSVKDYDPDNLEDRFATVPGVGEDFTIDGVVYRVERVTRDDYLGGVEFMLRTMAK